MRKRGFTLIELLIVISIIGTLAAISVVTLQYTKNRAKIARARSELNQLQRIFVTAQQERSRALTEITLNNCTDCSCRTGDDMRNTTGECFTDWQSALTLIEAETNGAVTNALQRYLRDPWGSPYDLDENEREFGPSDCRLDTFRSFGPDGIRNTVDDINLTGDAYLSELPLSRTCP